jgi:hypothetical protein
MERPMNERMREAGAGSHGTSGNGRRGSEAINEDLSDLAGRVHAAGSDAAESFKEHARQAANEQKDAGARLVRQFARAIERAADELDDGMPRAAQYVRGTAKQVDDLSASLSGRSVEDLAHAFTKLARARPGMVLGAGAIAGFALTRFLKSAGAHHDAPSHGGYAREPSSVQSRHDGPSLQPNGDVK